MVFVLPAVPAIAEVLAAAGTAAWAWATSATGVAVIGGAATGVAVGVAVNENAKAKAKEGLKTDAAVDACSTCPPPQSPQCQNAIENMRKKNADFKKEMKKYDPVSDAQGGHTFMAGGQLKKTTPGGHYKEMRDLQRGLKNELYNYNKNKCYEKASSDDKIVRNEAQDLSSKNIEIPPGISFIPL